MGRKGGAMKTAIVTDSSAYLTREQATAAGITVVPLTVMFGQEELFENETVSSARFYERMRTEELPTTAQAPLYRLDQVYQSLSAAGYDAVLSIHLSGALSGMVDSLRGFVKDYEGIKVYVHDSRTISAGLAYQALLAARMAADDASPEDIMPVLDKFNEQVTVGFVVDNLKHLLRTGRISGSTAFLGNLLAIKPVLTMQDGKIIPVGKERTAKRAVKRIGSDALANAAAIAGPVRYNIIDANNPDAVAQLREQVLATDTNATIDRSDIGPAVGVHTGEGVVGIFVAPDWTSYNAD
jgi:DegV family protein with EDD domain